MTWRRLRAPVGARTLPTAALAMIAAALVTACNGTPGTPPESPPSSVPSSAASSVPSSAASSVPSSAATSSESGADAPALPDVGLAGVNDPMCRSAGPPVLLLHGTVSTPASNFSRLAPALLRDDRCVYAVRYGAAFGWGGIGPVDDSAEQVAAFTRDLLTATGADRIDVVAFSQGALVLRDALQGDLDPAAVQLAVFIAPNYHGTTAELVDLVPAGLCPACADQRVGSPLLQRLADGGELAPGVRYATLSSRRDTWVLPVSGQAPKGPPDRVRTQFLEDSCPDLHVTHQDLPANPAVVAWVRGTLDTGGTPPEQLPCD